MGVVKFLLGFEGNYPWTKWLRIGSLVTALLVAFSIKNMFSAGWVMFIILFIIAYIITSIIAMAIGAAIGGVHSGKRQAQSLKESKASGSEETLELDKLRLKVQLSNLVFGLCVAACVITFMVTFISAGQPSLLVMVGGLVLLGFIWVLKAPINKRFKEQFKEQVVRTGLESVLTEMDYRPEDKLDEAIIKDSGIFGRYDVYNGNDYLSAKYNGTPFQLGDVHLQEERKETHLDSDGDIQTRTYYETIYMGRLFVLDYDAISNEPVFVFDKRMTRRKKSVTETEMDAFNKRFAIEAADALSAMRILTPQVQTGILDAVEKLGYSMSLSFLNDKVYVALYSGDSFEARVKGDNTLSEQRQRIKEQIQVILDLIDCLYKSKRGGNDA